MSETKETSSRKPPSTGTASDVFAGGLEALAQWRGGTSLNALKLPRSCRRILSDLLAELFRNRALLDWMLDARLQGRKVKGRVRDLLRLCLCSCLYHRGIPDAVAVSTCVELAKHRFGKRMSGLVNAVLRQALRFGPPAIDTAGVPAWVRLRLSPELYDEWISRMAPDEVAELADCICGKAPMILRARSTCPPVLPPEYGEALVEEPVPAWAGDQRLWRCQDAAFVLASPLFAQGAFYIQDPSTLLASSLVPVDPGDRVADLCAAPGGKALVLAEKGAGKAEIIVADRSWRRARTLRQNCAGQEGIQVILTDAANPAFRNHTFSSVLLDVPCSNTGVIRRRPDVRWRFKRHALAELRALQMRMLTAAVPLVKPGGSLVYSTCSIEPSENSDQVAEFLDRFPQWELVKQKQLLPCERHDGGYAALLQHAAVPADSSITS